MKTKIRTLVLHAATACGYAYGRARRPARFLPELAGLGIVAWGVGMELNPPAGVIVAGIELIVVGRQIPRLPSDDAR